MTNARKFKTAKERIDAFHKYCDRRKCDNCPLDGCPLGGDADCKFEWLELEAELTTSEVADILEEHNKWRRGKGKYAKSGAKCNITPKNLGLAIDRAVEILRDVEEEW